MASVACRVPTMPGKMPSTPASAHDGAKCGGGGYKGRVGIHELLTATDEMKRLIQKKASVETMRNQALKDGMRTLLQDGLAKAVSGRTDAKQVRAVCIK